EGKLPSETALDFLRDSVLVGHVRDSLDSEAHKSPGGAMRRCPARREGLHPLHRSRQLRRTQISGIQRQQHLDAVEADQRLNQRTDHRLREGGGVNVGQADLVARRRVAFALLLGSGLISVLVQETPPEEKAVTAGLFLLLLPPLLIGWRNYFAAGMYCKTTA